ncbi:MAG: 50S ribosomal protein L11 methyltransferase [Carboxylicivirga sp.]|jgi:ribosomal protein L11 methyltransferase|nr:50S ribosomal protein L11 methyltransferase [Carboxylicivirga sp.]MCT4643927.1 50S ribosomal protein L11 methyltransferase [Carboxylicivirga sp.]
MEYTKVEVKVNPVNQVVNEIVMAQMGEMGFDSFEETADGFNAYIPANLFDQVDFSLLVSPIDGIDLSFKSENIPDQNWNQVWEENYFQPITIGDQCIIRSTFHEVEHQCKYEIIINPRMAFGTGHHETTSLMVQQILEQDFEGLNVLDMGCGTGILGMLCSMKGAKQITGVDIDEWAYNNALESIELNDITNMKIMLGGAEVVKEELYDVVLANINLNILLDNIESYAKVLKDKGTIIFSGFYDSDLQQFNEVTSQYNLQMISQKTDNNWTSVAYIKSEIK